MGQVRPIQSVASLIQGGGAQMPGLYLPWTGNTLHATWTLLLGCRRGSHDTKFCCLDWASGKGCGSTAARDKEREVRGCHKGWGSMDAPGT